MAVPYSQIVTDTLQTHHKVLTDQIFTQNYLLDRWAKKGAKAAAGRSILEPVTYAKNPTAGAIDPYGPFPTTNNQKRTKYEFEWKVYTASIELFDFDEAINQGDPVWQINNMVKAEMENAQSSLEDDIAVDIWQAASTDPYGLVGIQSMIADTPTTGTYGGISRVTNTWWQNKTQSMTVLDLDTMYKGYLTCSDGNDSPSLCVTTKTIMPFYNAQLTPIQRISDATSGKAGFQKLYFLDLPIVFDNNCPSLHMYMINEKYIKWYYVKGLNFKMRDAVIPVNVLSSVKTIVYACMFFNSKPQRSIVFPDVAA